MAQQSTQALSSDKFLTVAANMLHRALLEAGRTRGKQIFRELDSGRTVGLVEVEMEDQSRARFAMNLDSSEFRGRLNFSAFRASLEMLVHNIAKVLREEQAIPRFNSQADDGSLIFGITGVTVDEGQPNVMVLGMQPVADGTTILRLMYLDPDQFARRSDGGEAAQTS
jgi:hypothetical protein